MITVFKVILIILGLLAIVGIISFFYGIMTAPLYPDDYDI